MATYSIYIGEKYETSSYPLVLTLNGTISTFGNNILERLLDNEDKLVYPRHLRDSILSLNDSNTFQHFTLATYSYMAFNDTKKILFGKRAYSGTQSYIDNHDILDTTLLTNDSDIFFFNTKKDTHNEHSKTSLMFLTGTNSLLYKNSPTIENTIETLYYNSSLTHSNTLSIVSSGDINIKSQGKDNFGNFLLSGGTVSVNKLIFKDINSINNINSKYLKYDNSKVDFQDPNLTQTSGVGTTNNPLNILGDLLVNGYNMEFTDSRWTSVDVGNIKRGSTFSKDSIASVLEEIVYSELPPYCFINFVENPLLLIRDKDGYIEPNIDSQFFANYTVNVKTYPINSVVVTDASLPIADKTQKKFSEELELFVTSDDIDNDFTLYVNDNHFTSSDQLTIKKVYPYFYGISTNVPLYNVGDLSLLNKKVLPKENTILGMNGNGYINILYPLSNGDIIIKDSNDVDITNQFVTGSIEISSPDGYWSGKFYKYFRSVNTVNYNFTTNIKIEYL